MVILSLGSQDMPHFIFIRRTYLEQLTAFRLF